MGGVKRNEKIRGFILANVKEHPANIVTLTMEKFGTTRQNVHRYLKRLSKEGQVSIIGSTKATRYYLNTHDKMKVAFEISPNLSEWDVWQEQFAQKLTALPQNVADICSYGFTEMVNNSIDHSGGSRLIVDFQIAYGCIEIDISDNGVGVFKKIQDFFGLESVKEAILHLSKGKLTTDKDRHSGEGIFFTSRMFDDFSILANDMYYHRSKKDGGDWWLVEATPGEARVGTLVHLSIPIKSRTEKRTVFDAFTEPGSDEPGFDKTHISIQLAKKDGETFISRSQAKRVMTGAERFKWVVIDLRGVRSVGQGFVDEVFRVWQQQHPTTKIEYVNANSDVEFMIKRGGTLKVKPE